MFSVFITSKAQREIRDIPNTIIPLIIKAIDELKFSIAPEEQKVKKIKGAKNTYGIRVRDWWVLYSVRLDTKEIFILSVMPRKKAYRKK